MGIQRGLGPPGCQRADAHVENKCQDQAQAKYGDAIGGEDEKTNVIAVLPHQSNRDANESRVDQKTADAETEFHFWMVKTPQHRR